MERKSVEEIVFRIEHWGAGIGESAPENLIAFIAWAEAALEKIPAEYRAIAEIDIDSVGGYEDEHHVEIEVSYWRPETDQEMIHRAERERSRIAEQESQERAVYAALRQKYGP